MEASLSRSSICLVDITQNLVFCFSTLTSNHISSCVDFRYTAWLRQCKENLKLLWCVFGSRQWLFGTLTLEAFMPLQKGRLEQIPCQSHSGETCFKSTTGLEQEPPGTLKEESWLCSTQALSNCVEQIAPGLFISHSPSDGAALHPL